MKKTLYLFLAILTCMTLMTGCSFFNKPDKEDTSISSDTETDTTDGGTTEEEGEEVPVGNPEDLSSEESSEDKTTETENNTDTDTGNEESSNPRENVTTNPSKEYTATGKYCGFIDSTSVEVELSDGSYCSFFVFDEEVRSTLSALNEEDMPEISFTYKAKEGQVNPEMTSVIGG